MSGKPLSSKMRIYHRYLGFFLAGIMAVYAISGMVLIFRDTDFLKRAHTEERNLEPNMAPEAVGQALRIRNFSVTGENGDVISFERGTYNRVSGVASVTNMELPLILNKLTKLHKAKSADPLFFLNIFFGLSLFFFVLSSFWMFTPKSKIFRKGMYFTLGGIILTILLIAL